MSSGQISAFGTLSSSSPAVNYGARQRYKLLTPKADVSAFTQIGVSINPRWKQLSQGFHQEKCMGVKRTAAAIAVACTALAVTGCATWSTSNVDSSNADPKLAEATATKKTVPSQITISDGDVVDRRYASLGDISVTVNKTTVFHADPTKEMVNDKLREKAADMGADAVLLVRYGNGGISMMSWGSLEGKGRAVKFLQ